MQAFVGTQHESNIPDQSGKVFVVTGTTSGLGEETARVLSRKNATVIMAAKNIKKAESVANEILVENNLENAMIQKLLERVYMQILLKSLMSSRNFETFNPEKFTLYSAN